MQRGSKERQMRKDSKPDLRLKSHSVNVDESSEESPSGKSPYIKVVRSNSDDIKSEPQKQGDTDLCLHQALELKARFFDIEKSNEKKNHFKDISTSIQRTGSTLDQIANNNRREIISPNNPSPAIVTHVAQNSCSLSPQSQTAANKEICPPALRERGYEINEEIGEGAFSRVYRARLKAMADKEIAVKIIALDKVPEVWREKCLRQELRIVRKLQHPHIIKVWDIIKTRRNVFIFMDLAENNSVLHFMQAQGRAIPETVARIWFTQVVGAIAYMHSKGIAHRDLKNENILLDRDHSAKLTDFGFACFTLDKDTKLVPLIIA